MTHGDPCARSVLTPVQDCKCGTNGAGGCDKRLHGVPHSTRLNAYNVDASDWSKRAAAVSAAARKKVNERLPSDMPSRAETTAWQVAMSDYIGARVTEGLIDAWANEDDPLTAVNVLRSIVGASTDALVESITEHTRSLRPDDENQWTQSAKNEVSAVFAREHLFCSLVADLLQVHDLGKAELTELLGNKIADQVLGVAIVALGGDVPPAIRAGIRAALRAATSAAMTALVSATAGPHTITGLRVTGIWLCPNIPVHPVDPDDPFEPGVNLVDEHCVKKLSTEILSKWVKQLVHGWLATKLPTANQEQKIIARAST